MYMPTGRLISFLCSCRESNCGRTARTLVTILLSY